MATMTNAMIIESYKIAHNISCPIHTYAKWRELGYQVKRGETSQHKITIWKCAVKVKHNDEDNADYESSKLFMKTAAFFTVNQVEPIKA